MSTMEPSARSKPVPALWIGILFLLLFWADRYVMNNGGDLMGSGGSFPKEVYYPIARYKDIPPSGCIPPQWCPPEKVSYVKYCISCHQDNGQGMPGYFPPLAGSDWVNASKPDRLIRIVLDGMTGPITRNGVHYNGTMLPWRDVITDDAEIAAALTFIRQSWGNQGADVSAEEVTKVRQATLFHRGRPWTADELKEISDND